MDMATTLVPVEEYHNIRRQHDADGESAEHGSVQARTAHLLLNYPQLWVATGVRVRTNAERQRIPDVLAVRGRRPAGPVIAAVPYIVVEVISLKDRRDDLDDKIHEYLDLGVPNVWEINPRSCQAFIHTRGWRHTVQGGILRTHGGEIEIPLSEIFTD